VKPSEWGAADVLEPEQGGQGVAVFERSPPARLGEIWKETQVGATDVITLKAVAFCEKAVLEVKRAAPGRLEGGSPGKKGARRTESVPINTGSDKHSDTHAKQGGGEQHRLVKRRCSVGTKDSRI